MLTHAPRRGQLLTSGASLPARLAMGILSMTHVPITQVGHRENRLRASRLLLDRDGPPVPVELHDAEPLGILHVVAEHGRAPPVLPRPLQVAPQPVAVEDVVAQHERARVAVDEVLADGERLRQPVRRGPLRVVQLQPELRAILQQVPEVRQVLRRQDRPE